MPKIVVDAKLAETLKSMRLERKIAAKDLAEKWEKSTSYVSKLENGNIKSIELKDLERCLEIIVGTSDSEKYLSEMVKTVTYKFSKEEIENFLWMDNFDKVYRRIPVSETFVNDITEKMQKHNISVERLVDQINTNEFMPQHLREKANIPINTWFHVSEGTYIRMQVAYSDIESILSQKKKKSNYVKLFAMALYLDRLIDYGHVETYAVSEEEGKKLYNQATAYLEAFRIYTLTKKANLLEHASADNEYNERLSLYDRENFRVLRDAQEALAFYSDYDVSEANKLIKQFTDNMKWDSPFIMQIAGLPFYELEHCSFRIKKEMLDKIRRILDETLEIPDEKRRLEKY